MTPGMRALLWTAAPLVQAARPLAARGPDGGPVYVETHLDRLIAEPFNAVSALLFVAIAVYWAVRLRGRYRRFAFLSCCLPLLAAGGVGGTVYHAFRAHRAFLLLDWLPIAILCLAVAIYLWVRILRRWWPLVLLIVPAIVLAGRVNFQLAADGVYPRGWAINVNYTFMAVVVLVPWVVVLAGMRFAGGFWSLAAAVCFALAVAARGLDAKAARLMPMGSHWLWHVFSAAATQCLAVWLYRLRAAPSAAAEIGLAGASAGSEPPPRAGR